jgi:hypothetical protein
LWYCHWTAFAVALLLHGPLVLLHGPLVLLHELHGLHVAALGVLLCVLLLQGVLQMQGVRHLHGLRWGGVLQDGSGTLVGQMLQVHGLQQLRRVLNLVVLILLHLKTA